MFCLLVNNLYRFNLWLDSKELVKLFVLITCVLAGNILLFASDTMVGLISGISVYILICSLAILRTFFQNGSLRFNGDIYDVPVVGERLIVTKGFYWDGSFKKFINPTDPSRKPWWYTIGEGKEFIVVDISKSKGDWEMKLTGRWNDGSAMNIVVNYFESRKYWKTKSDIRDEKLRKIGI